MKRQLLLIRHAEAANMPGVKDFDRPLTDKGLISAAKLGRALNNEDITIDWVYSSTALRAADTCKLIAEQLRISNAHITFHEALYNINLGGMLNLVQHFDDLLHTIAIIGHNPTLSYLAEYVTHETGFNLETGMGVLIQFEADTWFLVGESTGKVAWSKTF